MRTTKLFLVVMCLGFISYAALADEVLKNEGTLFGPKSRIRIGGRAAIGVVFPQDSGALAGPTTLTKEGSFVIPDAKLDINYDITPDIAGRVRFNANNAAAPPIDRLYIDWKNLFAQPWLNLRAGLTAIPFGEEFDCNNPIEAYGISNSAANVNGADEGIILFGTATLGLQPFGVPVKMLYDLGLYNGEGTVVNDYSSAKAWSGRLGFVLSDAIFISGSYYDSGKIVSSPTIAGQVPVMLLAGTATTGINTKALENGISGWDRQIWEADLQWRFGGDPAAIAKSPRWSKVDDTLGNFPHTFVVKAAYGQFDDDSDTNVANTLDRKGYYWYVEGTYNLTENVYAGGKYSEIDLDGNITDRLNRVVTTLPSTATTNTPNANDYSRVSGYIGYNITNRTNLKVEYTVNNTRYPTATTEPKDDYWALFLTTAF